MNITKSMTLKNILVIRKTLLAALLGSAMLGQSVFALEVDKSNLFWGKGERISVLEKTGKNLAFTDDSNKVHPKLTEHSRKMDQAVLQVDDNIYMAYGFGLNTPVMIVGDDGTIVVDPGESIQAAQDAKAFFDQITDKPVKAIVYTHNHIDHVAGVRAWVTDEQVASGEVQIIAHDTLTDAVANWSSNLGTLLGLRTSYTAGTFIDTGEHGSVNAALGPQFVYGDVSFIEPNVTFSDRLETTIAGVPMEIVWVPSETNDQIVVYLPEQQVLHAAEVLQGENFPNLHTIRGTRFRDPTVWYKGIDTLRDFEAEVMVNSHGRPVQGKENVAQILTDYRDAIQYVHDQTIRYMNQGQTPDELVASVTLPQHLAEAPWLGEHYGTVAHSVRQIYVGYTGWFEGDPWALEPLPHLERAQAYIDLMGGRDNILKQAQAAIDEGKYTWAAEILTYPIRVDHNDMEARQLKATAYKEWGYRQLNVNWRNWALIAAGELEDTLDYNRQIDFASPDVATALPTPQLMEMMTPRLIAEDTLDVNQTMAFNFTDTDQQFALEIRRGIAQLHQELTENPEISMELTRDMLNRMMLSGPEANTVMAEALQTGELKLKQGTMDDVQQFLAYFGQPLPLDQIKLIIR